MLFGCYSDVTRMLFGCVSNVTRVSLGWYADGMVGSLTAFGVERIVWRGWRNKGAGGLVVLWDFLDYICGILRDCLEELSGWCGGGVWCGGVAVIKMRC